MLPLWINIFQGFRSRCMILCRLSTLKAQRIWRRQRRALCQDRQPSFWMTRSRVPPLQNSYTKQKLLLVFSISTQFTMYSLSLRICDKILISLTVHSSSFGMSLNFYEGMTLIAKSWPVFMFLALNTFEKFPSPKGSRMR